MKLYRIFDNKRMEFNRNVIEYCNIFENLIDTKRSFENSLKFITDPDTIEILSIVNFIYLKKNQYFIVQCEINVLKDIIFIVIYLIYIFIEIIFFYILIIFPFLYLIL